MLKFDASTFRSTAKCTALQRNPVRVTSLSTTRKAPYSADTSTRSLAGLGVKLIEKLGEPLVVIDERGDEAGQKEVSRLR